jgi:hypothetical protein
MRISFDFDGCLGDNRTIQQLATALLAGGAEVFILTSRCKNLWNTDLFLIASQIGINNDNIIFACDICKAEIFQKMKFDLHFDDNLTDVHKINTLSDRKPAMLVNYEFGEPNNERDW